MIVKCIEPTTTLTQDKEYNVFGSTKTAYYIVANDGVERLYLKSRFTLHEHERTPNDILKDIHNKFRITSNKPTKVYKMYRKCKKVIK